MGEASRDKHKLWICRARRKRLQHPSRAIGSLPDVPKELMARLAQKAMTTTGTQALSDAGVQQALIERATSVTLNLHLE